MEIVSGLARAIGPLFKLERGDPDVQLLVQARGILQETLAKMQSVDQNYPGVADATAAIAESLRLIFGAMRDAGLAPPAPAAQGPAQPAVQSAAASAPSPPSVSVQASAASPAGAPSSVGPVRSPSQQLKAVRPNVPTAPATTIPAGTVPIGPNGLPRLEAEVGVHSETNFYTDFLGDIRNHGGIFVATFHVLPIDTPCEVVLTFPGNLTAEVRGVVKWRREGNPSLNSGASPGLGVEITEASPEAWNLIDRFIRKREPMIHEV